MVKYAEPLLANFFFLTLSVHHCCLHLLRGDVLPPYQNFPKQDRFLKMSKVKLIHENCPLYQALV